MNFACFRILEKARRYILLAFLFSIQASLNFAQTPTDNYQNEVIQIISGQDISEKLECNNFSAPEYQLACFYDLIFNEKIDRADSLLSEMSKLNWKDSTAYAFYCGSLARLDFLKGEFKNADSLYRIYRKVLYFYPGLNTSIQALFDLEYGHLKMRLDDFDVVDSLYSQINRSIQGGQIKNEYLKARFYEYWGLLKIYQSDFEESEILLNQSYDIWEKLGDPDHPWRYSLLNHLGLFLTKTAKYEQAERILLSGLEGMSSAALQHRTIYADILSNLANVFRLLGNYNNALFYYKEALDAYQNKNQFIESATVLNNIALVYDESDSLVQADAYYRQAIEVYRENLGAQNLNYAGILNNLAGLLDYLEEYVEAESLYLECINIIESQVGKRSELYVTMLNNLGILYENMGVPEKSESKYLEALNIREELLGEKHPKYVELLYNLAGLYAYTDPVKAYPIYQRANIQQLGLMRYYYSNFDESTRMSYFDQMELEFERFYSLAALGNPPGNVLIDVQNFNLAIKGMSLEYHVGLRERDKSTSSEEESRYFSEWYTLRDSIARAIVMSKIELNQQGIDLNDLIFKADLIERRLARTNDKTNYSQGSYKQLKQKLTPGEASIDFVKFEIFRNGYWTDSIFYYAIICKPESEYPAFVEISGENKIRQILSYLKSPELNEGFLQELYELIWKPLERHLQGIDRVYLSPAGLLYQVPFCGLTNGNTFLFQDHSLHIYGAIRDFLNENDKQNNSRNILLAGGIDFNNTDSEISNEETLGTIPQSFIQLPGTLREITAINDIATKSSWKSEMVSEGRASEQEIRHICAEEDFRVLHFATHGFFYNYSFRPELSDLSLRNKIVTTENPLVRSGLVFSGINKNWISPLNSSGEKDGVLNALEIANMNLEQTELVVLSACETGLGELHNEEGVFGLQRAFRMAGTKKLIYTLWELSDEKSSEFMQIFYSQFFNGNSINDSFRIAQNQMSKKYPPYYWAVFVLVQ